MRLSILGRCRERPVELTFLGLGAPWGVNMELWGATIVIEPTAAPLRPGGGRAPLQVYDLVTQRIRGEEAKLLGI